MRNLLFKAVIFDLDGVVTRTARVHASAWKAVFDDYLKVREKRYGEPFKEFTHDGDYLGFVDGKPRYKGVRSFLKSRGIDIPMGKPSDTPEMETVCGIGNRKNVAFKDVLNSQGIDVYESTIKLIEELRRADVRIGVASSSRNCKLVLQRAGIEDLFETRVGGEVSAQLGLKGKPEGDIFVVAARNLGVSPDKAIVVEDASSGVQAGRNGAFNLVIGLARKNNASKLIRHGADIVVKDLEEITVDFMNEWFTKKPKSLIKGWDDKKKLSAHALREEASNSTAILNPFYFRTPQMSLINGKRLIFIIDYDGTLAPIADRPEEGTIDDEMRECIRKIALKHTVIILSGRMKDELEFLLNVQGICYAGCHGFDIGGEKFLMVNPKVKNVIPIMAYIAEQLGTQLKDVPGIIIEQKKFNVTVHYRLVETKRYMKRITSIVRQLTDDREAVRVVKNEKSFDILPNLDWHKGRAVRWIMKALKISWLRSSVVYIGDNIDDEDVFRTIRTRGTAILLSKESRISAAHFQLSSQEELKKMFINIDENT